MPTRAQLGSQNPPNIELAKKRPGYNPDDYKGKLCSFIDYINDKTPCHGEGHNCRDHLESLTPEAKKKNEELYRERKGKGINEFDE